MNTEGLCLGCMSDNGGEKICPICGFDNDSKNPADCLPVKSVIRDRYLLGKALKKDGEGITYIGWDNSRTAKIKIKEYFPDGVAERNPDKTVAISQNARYTFNEGLMDFIEVNRAIMNHNFPALVQVFDVFEENGTAYAVTEYISGITLEQFLNKNGGSLKWEQARPLFLPLIDTIANMHEIGIIHGGISTDTVIVGRDGKLRLNEYAIKKFRVANDEIKFKIYAGFAACEQYGINNLTVGTYTDVYSLCATLFRVLIGVVPPEASQRINNDAMTIPAKFAQELPRPVLAALANGLQVYPQNRTKNIEIFKNELVYGEIEGSANNQRVQTQKTASAKTEPKKSKKKGSSAKYVIISALCTVLVLAAVTYIFYPSLLKNIFEGNNPFSQNEAGISSVDTPSFVEPEVNSIGDVESGAEISTVLYSVPDFSGKYFAEVIEDKNYEMFEIIVKDKVYSDTYPAGTICKQSKKDGSQAPRDTKIQVTISLGPKEILIANLAGLEEVNAKLELLKQGFLYENIEVLEKYDEDSEPGVVIDQSPAYGERVSPDTAVEIYINSYKGDTSSETESTNSSNSNQITDNTNNTQTEN